MLFKKKQKVKIRKTKKDGIIVAIQKDFFGELWLTVETGRGFIQTKPKDLIIKEQNNK